MTQVLITRAEPEASASARRIAALGLRPLVAPIFTAITAAPVEVPASIAATLLTSRRAVAACPASLQARPLFAVGPATAALATEAGFRCVIDADGDADRLAATVVARIDPGSGTLFLPTAPGQGTRLARTLRQHGFHVLRRIVYRTVPEVSLPTNLVTALQADCIAYALFFSTESAAHFVRLLNDAGLADFVGNVEAVAISGRPVMALKRLPWRRISVAEKPNQDAMLALLR